MVQLDLHPDQAVALVVELELARERASDQATQITRATVDEQGLGHGRCDEQALGQAHDEARLYERLLHGLAHSERSDMHVVRAPTTLMYDLINATARRAIDQLAQAFAAVREPGARPTGLDLMSAGQAAHAWMVTYTNYHFVDGGPSEP